MKYSRFSLASSILLAACASAATIVAGGLMTLATRRMPLILAV